MEEMKNDGGPAFPIIIPGAQIHLQGISVRDYFSAKAMQGMLADPTVQSGGDPETLSKVAYAYADAMLAEREIGM